MNIIPKYKNTIVCRKCGAVFNPNKRYELGFYRPGLGTTTPTSDDFIRTRITKKYQCPICKYNNK